MKTKWMAVGLMVAAIVASALGDGISFASPAGGGKGGKAGRHPMTKTAYFAGGCFWGVEYHMEMAPGVLSAESGYMGGEAVDPTYEQVCSGTTGHLEAVKVVYDPKKTSYEALARLFFEIHDPTQADGQGPDIGEQYMSAVFYRSQDEKADAERLIDALRVKGYNVVTQVREAGRFWRAEEYHQDYYKKAGSVPYCHMRVDRFGEK